ncbi:prostasin-like [Oratosquilla oratoria]|uniref:prostasin-like n=1 Tax=Oratosquilla oratoria TaxID=337810 RepID=UPI003F769028
MFTNISVTRKISHRALSKKAGTASTEEVAWVKRETYDQQLNKQMYLDPVALTVVAHAGEIWDARGDRQMQRVKGVNISINVIIPRQAAFKETYGLNDIITTASIKYVWIVFEDRNLHMDSYYPNTSFCVSSLIKQNLQQYFHVDLLFLSVADVECGRPQKRLGRIKNGQDARPGEYPWLVSVKIGDGGHICAGALINKRIVITAAHCINRQRKEDLQVVAGEHNIKSTEPSGTEQVFTVAQVYVHENYTRKYINDICMIILSENVSWTSSVRPLCLPDNEVDGPDDSLDKKRVSVAGWGLTDVTSKGGKVPDVLQKMEVKVIPRAVCQDWYVEQTNRNVTEKGAVVLYETHLCAGEESGYKDSCYGQSETVARPILGWFCLNDVLSAGVFVWFLSSVGGFSMWDLYLKAVVRA